MLVAIVDFEVRQSDRSDALRTLIEAAPTVEAMAGCITFRPHVDPRSETQVGVVHEWRNKEAFESYLASETFAGLNKVLRPIAMRAPNSRRYAAERLE